MLGNTIEARQAEARYRGETAGWLALFAVLTMARAPSLIVSPRLWAEEATVYLAHAFGHGVLSGALLIPTTSGPAGYLNIAASIPATVAAKLVGLEVAPWVFLVAAFAIQWAPAAVVLSGRSRLWPTRWSRLAVAAILTISPPVVPEVWLNTTNAQIFCGLLALIIAAEDPATVGVARSRLFLVLLTFCGLSGPYTAMLLPVFVYRWWRVGSSTARAQAGVVAICAVVQGVLATWVFATAAQDLGRFDAIGLIRRPPWVLLHHLLVPFFGDRVTLLADGLGWRDAMGGESVDPTSLALIAVLASGLVVASVVAAYRVLDREARILLLAVVCWSVGTTLFAYRGIPAGRYAVLPGLAWLLVAGWLARAGTGWIRRLAIVLSACALTVGVVEWRDGIRAITTAPDWREEVAAWRADPAARLRVAPVERRGAWRVSLPSVDRFEAAQAALAEAVPVTLRSTGAWDERVFRVPGLPPDFTLQWRVGVSRGAEGADLVLALRDREGRTMASQALRGLPVGRARAVRLDSEDLLLGERPASSAAAIVFRLRASGSAPVQASISEVTVTPRVVGVLDPILPRLAWPRTLAPVGPRPVGDEVTWLLAAESLWRDGDLQFARPDRARARERWPDGARGLRLVEAGDGLRFPVAPWLAAAWAPWLAAGGPALVVLINVLLYALVLFLADRRLAALGSGGRVFGLGLLVTSGAVAFVSLPQPTVTVMVLLFVPAWMWMAGRLDHPRRGSSSGAVGLATGAALGAAASVAPVPSLLLAAAVVADLARRRKPSSIWLAVGVATAWAVLAFAPRLVSGDSGEVKVFDHRLPRAERWADDFERMGAPARVAPTADGQRGETRALAEAAWRFAAAPPAGTLFAFSFVWLAVVFTWWSPPSARQSTLLGVLAVATGWAIWVGASTPPVVSGDVLHGAFVPLVPLFALLPQRLPSRRVLLVLLVVAGLAALPSLGRVWPTEAVTAGASLPEPP